MYTGRDDIEIKITLLNSATLFARATVILFGCWEIHGWRVMKSTKLHPVYQENIWIQAPCFKTTNSKGEKVWKEIVYITDKPTWELVHGMIYDAFHMERSKKEGLAGLPSKSTNSTSEEVNPNEIPF